MSLFGRDAITVVGTDQTLGVHPPAPDAVLLAFRFVFGWKTSGRKAAPSSGRSDLPPCATGHRGGTGFYYSPSDADRLRWSNSKVKIGKRLDIRAAKYVHNSTHYRERSRTRSQGPTYRPNRGAGRHLTTSSEGTGHVFASGFAGTRMQVKRRGKSSPRSATLEGFGGFLDALKADHR